MTTGKPRALTIQTFVGKVMSLLFNMLSRFVTAFLKLTLHIHWKDWCWSSNMLVTWCEELTHWKRPWCWERLRAEGEESSRGWDGWMASPTQWTWVWASSGSWWRTGKPGQSDMTEWLNNGNIFPELNTSLLHQHYSLKWIKIFSKFSLGIV